MISLSIYIEVLNAMSIIAFTFNQFATSKTNLKKKEVNCGNHSPAIQVGDTLLITE